MRVSKILLTTLGLLSLLAVLAGCQSNAEKIGQFCTDWQTAIADNKADCDKMGAALEEVVKKYDDIKLYGRTDDEESKQATQACQAAVDDLLKCVDNPSVVKVMEMLEAQD